MSWVAETTVPVPTAPSPTQTVKATPTPTSEATAVPVRAATTATRNATRRGYVYSHACRTGRKRWAATSRELSWKSFPSSLRGGHLKRSPKNGAYRREPSATS